MNRYERREGEATDRNIRGQEEATQQRGPLDWITRGDASGKRTSAGNPNWNIRARKKSRHQLGLGASRWAEPEGWDRACGEEHGIERPGLHGEEGAAAARRAGGKTRRA